MKISYEDAAKKILARSVQAPDGDCIRYTGPVNRDGYGRTFNINGRFIAPHRIVYIATTGSPVPEGLTLDHLCHTRSDCTAGGDCLHRACVNPEHLEPVSAGENGRRAAKPACRRGHRREVANTYVERLTGRRHCLTCRRERAAEKRAA